jgi:hypothetical protein
MRQCYTKAGKAETQNRSIVVATTKRRGLEKERVNAREFNQLVSKQGDVAFGERLICAA